MVEHHSSLTFTGETYQEAAKLLYSSRSKTKEATLQQQPVVMVVVVVVMASMLFLMSQFPWLEELVLPAVCVLAGVALGVVICVMIGLKLSKRTYESQQPVEYSYIFRDHAIEITQPFAHAIYSWEAIKQIVQGEKYWLLILTNNENLFLPLDVQAMSRELKDFLLVKVKG